MLRSHLEATENVLVAKSQIPANTGHSLHKGTPREVFIREFLQSHLPEHVAIGSGEIIDANSRPGESRNQFDIVIYKKTYPKLDFGGGISGFLIESVVATIEVKSTLTQEELKHAVGAARNAKMLTPNVVSSFHAGYVPPRILNYVVAYNGPAQTKTVYNWIPQIHSTLGISAPVLPPDAAQRLNTPSPSIDGIFILNKGFIYFDNVPIDLTNSSTRTANPKMTWAYADANSGSLLLLFLFLQTALSNIEGKWLRAAPYLASVRIPNLQFGPSDQA